MAGGGVEVDANLDLRRQHLLLDLQVGQAGHLRQPFAQQAGLGAQGVEILAEDADGDLRPHAGQHVVNAVGNRLPEAEAGRQILQALPDVGINRLLRPATGMERDLELGDMDAFGMLVELGPAGTAAHVGDFGQAAQGLLGSPGDADRLGQGRPGIEAQPQGDRALVERWQEGGREKRHGRRRKQDGTGRQHDQAARRGQNTRQRPAIIPFQPDDQPGFVLLASDQRRQQVGSQHRGHQHRYRQRCQDSDDVGDAERHEQPPLDAGQREQRHEDEGDDQRRVDDGGTHLQRGGDDRLAH